MVDGTMVPRKTGGGIMKDMRRDPLWIGMGTSFTKTEKRQCGWVSKQMNWNVGEES